MDRPAGPRMAGRVIAAALLCLLAGALGAGASGDPPQAPPLPPIADADLTREVAKVRGMVEDARWDEAVKTALSLSERFPARPELRILVGDTLLLRFQAQRAVEEYRGAMKAGPKVASLALGKLATALVALGRDREALQLLKEGEAAGATLSEGTLVMLARLEPDPKISAGILNRLAREHPEDAALKGQLALQLALAARGAAPSEPSASAFGAARVKEIYREPSVRVLLDGREVWLALDTGSESILLNEDTASRSKLPVLADTEYQGWGFRGPRRSRFVYVDRLEVAGRVIRGVPAILNRRDAEFWTNKAGYLSLAPFKDALVRYDRRRGVFSLHPSGTDPAALLGGAPSTLPVLWARDLPLVPVWVQGRGPYPFLVDTGAIYTLLDTAHAESLGIRVNTGKYGKLRAEGMSGSFTSSVAEQVTLGLGSVRYDRPVIFVTDVPQRFPVPVFGILGRDILNDYTMAFDGPLATLTLARY